MRRIKIVASCVLGPPRTQWEYGVTPGTREERWRKVWVRYEQDRARLNLQAMRLQLAAQEPPDPGPLGDEPRRPRLVRRVRRAHRRRAQTT